MLGVLAEGIKKVVKGIGIILMDILSEVDPEVFGSLEASKDVNEEQNLILEASSNKGIPIKKSNQTKWTNNRCESENPLAYFGVGPPFDFSDPIFVSNFDDD